MKIIKANKSHLDQLVELEKIRFSDNYSIKTLENDLKNKNNLMWVLLEEDKVLGYIDVFYIFDEANIQRIALFPACEGKGYATKMLKHAENDLKEKGVEKIYLEVSESNTHAVEFYIKNGYKETNRRKDYYSDLSDAIIMWKFF